MKTNLRIFVTSIVVFLAAYSHSQVWSARWLTDPSSTDDHGKRICVDRRGITYTAGSTTFDGTGNGSGLRIEVNAYSPSGALLWEQRFGPNNDSSSLGNIVTDDNYLYICTTEPGSGSDIIVRKLRVDNGEGSSTWAGQSPDNLSGMRRFNSASTNNDVAADISLDSDSNVFVAGTQPGTNGTDMVLIKFSPTGTQTYANAYSTSNVSEVAVAMDTLPNGTTVVAGTESPSGTAKWCAMRWNGGGTQTMSSGVSYNLNSDDAEVTDVAISSSGNVFLCGYLVSSSFERFAVGGFDGDDGSHIWHKSDYIGRALAITIWLDFVYATGVYNAYGANMTTYAGDPESLTVKHEIADGDYSSTWPTDGGQSVAGARFYNVVDVSFDGYTERGHAIAGAGNGNIYVTGVANDFSGQPSDGAFQTYLTLCYDNAGNLDFNQQYDGSTGSKMEDRAWAIGIVGAGTINITGESEGSVNQGPFDFATLQYRRHSIEPAETITTLFGTLVSGNLSSVTNSDDSYYRVEMEDNSASEEDLYPVDVRLTGTMPGQAISELSLHLEAKVDSLSYRQIVLFWNYDNDQWDQVDYRLATTSDSVVEVRVMGDPEPYIHDSTNEVKCRVGFELDTGDNEGWEAYLNHVEWHYVQ